MDKANLIAAFAGLSLASVTLVTAAVGNYSGPRATLFSPQDYAAATSAIEEDIRVSLVACKKLTGLDKKICTAEMRAAEKIRKADLEARYLGTFESAFQAQLARVDADFEVEMLKCEAQPDVKSACVDAAIAQRGKTVETLRKPA